MLLIFLGIAFLIFTFLDVETTYRILNSPGGYERNFWIGWWIKHLSIIAGVLVGKAIILAVMFGMCWWAFLDTSDPVVYAAEFSLISATGWTAWAVWGNLKVIKRLGL